MVCVLADLRKSSKQCIWYPLPKDILPCLQEHCTRLIIGSYTLNQPAGRKQC